MRGIGSEGEGGERAKDNAGHGCGEHDARVAHARAKAIRSLKLPASALHRAAWVERACVVFRLLFELHRPARAQRAEVERLRRRTVAANAPRPASAAQELGSGTAVTRETLPFTDSCEVSHV